MKADSLEKTCKELNTLLDQFGVHQLDEIEERKDELEKDFTSAEKIDEKTANLANKTLGRYYLMSRKYLNAVAHYRKIEKRSQSIPHLLNDYIDSIYFQLKSNFLTNNPDIRETSRLLDEFKKLSSNNRNWQIKACYYEMNRLHNVFLSDLNQVDYFTTQLTNLCREHGVDGSVFLLKHNLVFDEIVRETVSKRHLFVNTESNLDFEKYINKLSKLNITSQISNCFGAYITNNRKFILSIKGKYNTLCIKLNKLLSKPEVFFLHGETGSGKTFFVEEFKKQLEKKLLTQQKQLSIYMRRLKNPRIKEIINNNLIKRLHSVEIIVKNVSAYHNIDEAFDDIVLSTLIGLNNSSILVLFIDEVDSKLGNDWIIPRILAPINGQDFYFRGNLVNLSHQQLVIFLAASANDSEFNRIPKSPDFLSRIPKYNHIILPSIDESHFEKIYRGIALFKKHLNEIKSIEKKALMYVGIKQWESTREIELFIKHVSGALDAKTNHVQLFNFPLDVGEISKMYQEEKINLYDIEEDIYVDIV